MLRPTIGQIATKGESYYSVVIAVAKRAREITNELYEIRQKEASQNEGKQVDLSRFRTEQKPVKTAVEEFAARKYFIVEDSEAKNVKSE